MMCSITHQEIPRAVSSEFLDDFGVRPVWCMVCIRDHQCERKYIIQELCVLECNFEFRPFAMFWRI